MKKYIYCYFNTLGGFYGQPFFADHIPEEFVKIYNQSLFSADKETLESLKEDDLYYLGNFDNESGVIDSKIEFLCHLTDTANTIIAKKFGEVPGDSNA